MDTRTFIDKVGSSAIERAVGVGAKSVHAAKAANSFPASWYDRLDKLGRRKGHKINRSCFNWKTPKAAAEKAAA